MPSHYWYRLLVFILGTQNVGALFFVGPADKNGLAASALEIATAFLVTSALRLCL
jgi:hypothetical protein